MKSRFFIFLALVLALAAVFVTRQEQASVARQIQSIDSIDAAGNDSSAQRIELQHYVVAHMGTSASVTLKSSYDRDVAAAQASAAGGTAQGQVYAQAQAACSTGRTDSVTQARCVAAYVSSHATPATSPQAVATPILANYQYHYAAPKWTPDLAGGLWLGALASLIVAGGLWLTRRQHRR